MTFQLTLDKETKIWLREYYKEEHTILEYGSGGSTFLALQSNPNSKVYCCETGKVWLETVKLHAKKIKVSDRLYPIHLNVGATKCWGYPLVKKGIDHVRLQQFVKSSVTPWKILKKEGVQPDTVFIDGRFRNACFLTTLINCRSTTKVIWDDYRDRPYYHIFEDIIKPTEMIGRTAIFDLKPSRRKFVDIFNNYMHVYGDWR